MKKVLSILLVLTIMLTLLAGCTTTALPREEENVQPGNETETGFAKIGLGHSISIGKSKDMADGTMAKAQVDTVIAAVAFDSDDKVASITFDTAQTVVDFDEDLQVATDFEKEFKTKVELGDDYGMKGASQIDKEWFEQAAELEKWMVGKTVAEIKAMNLEEGRPADEDLNSLVTVTVGSYIAVVEEAFNNAIEVKSGGQTLGLGVSTTIAKSKSLDGDVLPRAQVDSTMTATSFDGDGKVVGGILDVAQVSVDFDGEGQITTDLDSDFRTKNELGDDYNMKGASQIDKEWFEQAEGFTDWWVGKSLSDILGMELEEGRPAEEDLTSTITVTVGTYLEVLEKAFDNAK